MARSTFATGKAKNTARSDHFWKLRCLKSARRGAKQISKSKCIQHGPDHFWQLQLRYRKSARRCGREAHLEVKMLNASHVRATFGSSDVEKVHAVVARSTFPSQKWKK